MNVPVLLLTLVFIAAGVILVVLGRRQRFSRAARGQDPGANIMTGVGVSLFTVGLLNLGRAFL